MAEALAKKYISENVYSAGTKPEKVNPLAIQVMQEIGIDISRNRSKSISESEISSFDIVVTLCGDARDNCTNFYSSINEHIHWNIEDPAKTNGTKKEKLTNFRIIR